MPRRSGTMTKAPSNSSPHLAHLDTALLIAEKPAGLLAVPGRGEDKQDCLSTRIQREFPEALAVHRLDMATSGLMMFARGADMHRHVSRMFRERSVDKRYVAVVTGLVEAAGEVDVPICADWPNRPKQKVDYLSGKRSLTRYRLLEHDSLAYTSRIELEPLTGRTHQLRVHMAAIGHLIQGDALYGRKSDGAADRLLLHASSLSFVHPLSGELVHFESAVPF